MRITRKFTPITIELEFEEDIEFFSTIIKDAQQYYMSHGSLFTRQRRFTDNYMKKTSVILEKFLT